MGRFLKSKKSKEGLSPSPNEEHPPFDLPVPSIPAPPPPAQPQQASKRKWGKKKKVAEPEPELNIVAALPSKDEFRTSLLMPNLSARFSMLRDQDDPKSLLGKASDDSVLGYRRRSQLGAGGLLYSSSGLSDIAEVSSLHDSIRPPFTDARQHSFLSDPGLRAEDDASIHSGSIMSRARPGEGNVLFGGRQKIYKIPIGDAGAVQVPGAGENRGMRGRALYEDDVSVSAFQKLRRAEREAERDRERKLSEQDSHMDLDPGEAFRSPSMSLYDEKRGTTSSTNSGPSMMSASTAPTSIAANSPGLPTANPANVPNALALDKAKSRRLYENGLDQHIQDQQSAALTRLASLNRPNGRSPSPMAHSKSSPNMHDPSSLAPRQGENKSGFTPPGSRPYTPREDADKDQALSSALKISDRGKATAMSQFSRPKQFSEEQFLQRQMSLMQQNRDKRSRTVTAGSPMHSPEKSACPAPLDLSRPRKGTDSSDNSWTPSPTTQSRSNSEVKVSPVSKRQHPAPKGQAGSFFTAMGDESEGDKENAPFRSQYVERAKQTSFDDGLPSPGIPPPSQRVPPPLFKHPAMRAGSVSPEAKKERRQAWTPGTFSPPTVTPPTELATDEAEVKPVKDIPRRDSDVLGNTVEDTGLKGLVREHLRHPSNVSSIYVNESSPHNFEAEPAAFDMQIPSIYSQSSNPWENEDQELPKQSGIDSRMEARPEQQRQASSPSTRNLAPPRHVPQPPPEPDWREELDRSHARMGSSETTHERKAFSSELAERQKAITENLKIKSEARSPSPLAPPVKSPTEEQRPLAMLRKASSREGMQRHEQGRSLKRMARGNQSNPSLPKGESSRSHSQESKRHGGQDLPISPPTIGRTLHSRLPRPSEEYYNAGHNEPDVPPIIGYERPSTSRPSTARRSPPDSSRTSSSQDPANSENSSGASQHRPSLATDERPSEDRGRSTDKNRSRGIGNSTPKTSSNLDRSTTIATLPSPPKSRAFSKNATPPLAPVSSAPNLNTNVLPPVVTVPATGVSPASPTSPPSGQQAPIFTFPQRKPGRARKNTVDKSQISDPTLISRTSNVDTVSLPSGASLRNGERDDIDAVLAGHDTETSPASPSSSTNTPPPVPQVNPRRKWGMFGKLNQSTPKETVPDVQDEYMTKPGGRLRIRKISSEGAGLNSRRKHEAVRMGDDEGVNGSITGGVF